MAFKILLTGTCRMFSVILVSWENPFAETCKVAERISAKANFIHNKLLISNRPLKYGHCNRFVFIILICLKVNKRSRLFFERLSCSLGTLQQGKCVTISLLILYP